MTQGAMTRGMVPSLRSGRLIATTRSATPIPRFPATLAAKQRGTARWPSLLLLAGHLLLRDHLPGEALAIDGELVVVDSRCRLAPSIQILPVPECVILTAPQPQAIQSFRTGPRSRAVSEHG